MEKIQNHLESSRVSLPCLNKASFREVKSFTGKAEIKNQPELEPLTKREKYTLDLKEIAKTLKQQFKTEFPGCVFSVSIQRYSMGQSLHVSLMQSNFKVIRDFESLSEMAIANCESRMYTRSQIQEQQAKKYHQLNQYTFKDEYDPDKWNNGVFITEQGYKLFKRVVELVNHYNYDNSDPMTDYFDVNFYLHLNIGKWNQEFKEG